ncbi:Transglutaminase-like superfamily protein [Aquisphaera giovannonii]|uniref:Transglutaminase-like superfamily protein n=1 Tax=Aquisphaera giovannonii TaxID=406548 RepID=A0A5B9W862_9BACT|nr:transglutaminase domain-containing protein [Aquisphaera giovannonii]QEH36275.1 Transglutaminase-like superfamily protein [Aquisphaera giovannonii]
MFRRHDDKAPLRRALPGVVLLLLAAGQARAQEAWDAIFLKDNPIGHVHTFIEKLNEKGRELYRVRQDQVYTIRRLDDAVTMKLMYGTIETPEGEVLRLDTRTLTSDSEIRVHGDVIKGEMKLIMDTGQGHKQEKVIPWGPDVRGPYGAEQSMAKKPMEEGEVRVIKSYVPDLNRVVDFTYKAGGNFEVVMGDRSKRVLRKIDQTATLDGRRQTVLDAVLWADSGGQVLKLETDMMGGITMLRTTREAIDSLSNRRPSNRLDEIRSTIIPIGKIIPNPRATRYVKYGIALKDGDPSEVFPADNRQAIEAGSDKNSLVLSVNTGGPTEGASSPEPDAVYARPNAIIASDDSVVRRKAQAAIGDATTPWEKATRISHWVFENIREKNFAVAFAPANEVARNLTGDCSEHAVLAAAMSRAVGIPSRVAVGLLFVDNERQGIKGFGYHVWHEVYVNNRWVALDASWDQTSVDATHIKLADTALDGVAPFEAFLPIARIQGKLTIDPIELR